MSLLGPAINTSVTVDVAGWSAPRSTRVEELDETVVVADPLVDEGDHEPMLGSSVRISWQSERGPAEMPAVLVSKELRTVHVWRLEPDGPAAITQRRHHVRIATLLPLVLRSDHETLAAHLVDLSEGGLKSVCPAPVTVSVGDRLGVRFDVDGQLVDVNGTVVRVDPHEEHVCVGCRFVGTSPQQADVIRKFVFDRQAKERRLRNAR